MNAYDFSALTIDGIDLPLSQYRGHPLLIVNVASKCGFTPQYAGLEALYKQYHERGLRCWAFPVISSVIRNPAMRRPSRHSAL